MILFQFYPGAAKHRSMNKVSERIRVLIVDDIPQVRQELATMLKLASKNTSPQIEIVGDAQNGEEAIHQSQQLCPDVILMDLEMPILNGFEATRLIKSTQQSIRVIILSIHAGPEEQKLAQAAGADAFVIKGSSHDALMNAILSRYPPG